MTTNSGPVKEKKMGLYSRTNDKVFDDACRFVIKFAVIGITAGWLLFDQPFGFLALLGTMILSGMMIKNAIVLMDNASENKEMFCLIAFSNFLE